MTRRPLLSLLATGAAGLLLTTGATAQSFNIAAGAPPSLPTSAYGAGAAQPGVWFELLSGSTAVPLTDITGTPTAVTATTMSGGDFMFDNPNTTGDDELLMDHLLDAPQSVVISGLAQGTYTVYTYAWAPDNATYETEVAVTNSPDPPESCIGAWPGMHVRGVTYAMHTVTIDSTTPDLEILFTLISGFSSCNGIQIVDPSGGGGLGNSYCGPGNVNSTGMPAEISATGSVAASANNLTLMAKSLPNNAFGFFLTSQVQGFTPNPGGSEGNLCLGGSIGRYVGPGQIQNSGSSGTIQLQVDLTQTPTPTGFVSIQAGESWNFQLWHRDAGATGPTSNFTDGLELTFI